MMLVSAAIVLVTWVIFKAITWNDDCPKCHVPYKWITRGRAVLSECPKCKKWWYS